MCVETLDKIKNIADKPRGLPLYKYIPGYAVAQLAESLCYKPEGRGFDSRWCQSFRPHYGPCADSAFNRNEYQE
jgi:hypothetical protein